MPIMKITFQNLFNIFFSFFCAKISLTTLFFVLCVHSVADMDASHPWQIGFQDPATPIMEGIIFFNGLLMTFMIFIGCLVGWLLYKSLTLFDESVHTNSLGFTHSTLLEVVWTIIPAVILMIISIPSYNLLYAMDEVIDPNLTIKVVGHQWYWSYECSDFEVSPKGQEISNDIIVDARESQKLWFDILGILNDNRDGGKIRPLIKELLDFLDNNLIDLSENDSKTLAFRLNFITLLFNLYQEREDYDSDDACMDSLETSFGKSLVMAKYIAEYEQKIANLNKDSEFTLADFLKKVLENFKFQDSKKCSSCKGSDSSDNDSSDDGSVVTDLMDFDKSNPYWEWCELVAAEKQYDIDDGILKKVASEALFSENICNNAALVPEENDTPFSELMENMKQDGREFKKAIPIANLSEDKLIDTQLIEHQLRLTRPERESFSSEYVWNSAVVASNFAESKFKIALTELNNAKLHSHWAKIELASANVNKLTAEYLQADAALGVTDPLLIRSLWINKKGYYSWHEFLRLAIKKLSDVDKLIFLKADEELNGANFLLAKAQKNLTPEECDKSNSIADNAKAEFLAMEREVIPAIDEFLKGKVILENAKSELKTFQDISDRADVRLEKAQVAFDQAKLLSDRAKAQLNAAESVYKSAQAKLTDSDSVTRSVINKNDLDSEQLIFENLIKEFDTALSDVDAAKSDLLIAQKRFEEVKAFFEKTESKFLDTGLLEIQTPLKGKPIEYYHNFFWEIHNEDLSFVETQLKTDKAELESANIFLNAAEKKLSQIGGELLEAELNVNKVLIKYLENHNFDLILLNIAKKQVSGLELCIAEAIYTKALANFESDGLNTSKDFLARAEKSLSSAKLKDTKDYLGSVLDNNFNKVDSEKLVSDFAERCVFSAQEELKGAEADYDKASSILLKAKNLLENVSINLSKDYDNPYLDTLKSLYKNTLVSLEERIEQFNLTRLESSPLDIKLEPGLLQSKSYREVLLAKAELANIKWLCARVAKTLDISLSEEVKPFNVQFSHLKSEDSAIIGSNDNLASDKTAGDDDTKGSRSDADLQGRKYLYDESTYEQEIKNQIKYIKEELAICRSRSYDDDDKKQPINFDSYLIADEDLVIPEALGTGKAGTVFRLLEVDNRLFVPTNTHIRLLITSADVLHSWAVPSLGVKVDACPGRLNQVFLFVKREGVFYGQCSELCGVNHGFMPIVVQAVSQDDYITWVGKRLCS